MSYLVGSTAGGGSDVTARLVGRHLERHIPGKPRIDIINKPGAGGLIAANELYNLRKPDGLSFSRDQCKRALCDCERERCDQIRFDRSSSGSAKPSTTLKRC